MIQVATENFSQEDFLGLGKKNKAKRQEKQPKNKTKPQAHLLVVQFVVEQYAKILLLL